METQHRQETVSNEEIRAILRDVAMLQKESKEQDERRQRENEQRQKEYEVWKKEFDRSVNKRMNQLEGLFTSQWGKLVESLTEGDLVSLLQGRGIRIDSVWTRDRGRRGGEDFEFDIVAMNSVDIVVVEVKSMMKVGDVKHFLGQLKKFPVFRPQYEDRHIYGAVAYLRADERADRYAQRQGLLVIRATGKSARIVNEEGFKPKRFN